MEPRGDDETCSSMFGPTGEENPKAREEKLAQKAFLHFFFEDLNKK
jgi:hypothetical protein